VGRTAPGCDELPYQLGRLIGTTPGSRPRHVPGRRDGKIPVRIEIFDVQGRQVVTLTNVALAPGQYATQWTGRDAAGHTVVAGVYYCALRVGDTSAIRTLVVLK
jgi:hypothetical protein